MTLTSQNFKKFISIKVQKFVEEANLSTTEYAETNLAFNKHVFDIKTFIPTAKRNTLFHGKEKYITSYM